jgi:hypothetical protein
MNIPYNDLADCRPSFNLALFVKKKWVINRDIIIAWSRHIVYGYVKYFISGNQLCDLRESKKMHGQ